MIDEANSKGTTEAAASAPQVSTHTSLNYREATLGKEVIRQSWTEFR